jgi:hypothetical protein
MKGDLINIRQGLDNRMITLAWNSALYSPKQPLSLRHHLVVYHNKADKINTYINSYIRKLKRDDLFSLLYSNAELCFKYIPMQKKTQNDART